MRKEEFIALTAPEQYDFSNDGANAAYCALDNAKNSFEKFFGYMAVHRAYEQKKENIMKYGADYSMKCREKFKGIPDPDSGSKLLQEIYSLLWDESNLQYCRSGKGSAIQGDTMNSANTTLTALYKLMETPEHKEEREAIKTEKGESQKVSIRYILSRYAEDVQGHTQQFDKIPGMRFFTSIYHTLGNFIPVPAGCNGPRGMGVLQDYWDLTLNVIHGYYLINGAHGLFDDHIKDIVGEKRSKIYKDWLESFNSWDDFVEKNYLQDFVNYDDFGCYGKPKELWKGHFSGGGLPEKKEDMEQFYVNASSWIIARSVRMMQRLRTSCLKCCHDAIKEWRINEGGKKK